MCIESKYDNTSETWNWLSFLNFLIGCPSRYLETRAEMKRWSFVNDLSVYTLHMMRRHQLQVRHDWSHHEMMEFLRKDYWLLGHQSWQGHSNRWNCRNKIMNWLFWKLWLGNDYIILWIILSYVLNVRDGGKPVIFGDEINW